jgi:hypothetical protein
VATSLAGWTRGWFFIFFLVVFLFLFCFVVFLFVIFVLVYVFVVFIFLGLRLTTAASLG